MFKVNSNDNNIPLFLNKITWIIPVLNYVLKLLLILKFKIISFIFYKHLKKLNFIIKKYISLNYIYYYNMFFQEDS